MTDVFISYSRDDGDFGRELHTALTKSGRDVWMDWTSIPLTAEWWKEITEGIENSDNFLFLISPSSVASPICNLEVAYARSLNKRIIPTLIRITDEKRAHVELIHKELTDYQIVLLAGRDLLIIARDNWNEIAAPRNWVDFTSKKTFEEHLIFLNTALDTDIEYVHEHTRLLTRANDWDRRSRLPSLLVQDDDLKVAEAWLATAIDKKPIPLQLHHEFIAASRQSEDKRLARAVEEQRRILQLTRARFGISAVGFISVVLILLAMTLSLNEVQSQRSAVESMRLAVLADTDLNETDNAETAALLSIRALKTTYTQQADTSLGKIVNQLYTRTIFYGHKYAVQSVAFSPDGKYVLSGSSDETLRLWDVATGKNVKIFEGHTGLVQSVAFSPDGKYVLSGSSDETLRLWDVATGEVLWVFEGHTGLVQSVAFSPDGKYVLSGSSDKTMRLWDVATGKTLRVFKGHTDGILTVAFSPDGKYVLSGSGDYDKTLRLWDVSSGTVAKVFDGQWSTGV